MTDLLSHLVDAPIPNILIFAGLAFLTVAVLGKVNEKIQPNTSGRIMSGVLGAALLIFGTHAHASADDERDLASANSKAPSVEDQQRQIPPRRAANKRASGASAAESGLVEEPVRFSDGMFSGVWKNDNPHTRGVTKLDVRQNGDTVRARAWASCGSDACDWGEARGDISGESASILWDQGFVVRKMTLSPDGGRLRMDLDNLYRDKHPEAHRTEYFVRSE